MSSIATKVETFTQPQLQINRAIIHHPNVNRVLIIFAIFMLSQVFIKPVIPIYMYHILIASLVINGIFINIQYTVPNLSFFTHSVLTGIRLFLSIGIVALTVYYYTAESINYTSENTWLSHLVFCTSAISALLYPVE